MIKHILNEISPSSILYKVVSWSFLNRANLFNPWSWFPDGSFEYKTFLNYSLFHFIYHHLSYQKLSLKTSSILGGGFLTVPLEAGCSGSSSAVRRPCPRFKRQSRPGRVCVCARVCVCVCGCVCGCLQCQRTVPSFFCVCLRLCASTQVSTSMSISIKKNFKAIVKNVKG